MPWIPEKITININLNFGRFVVEHVSKVGELTPEQLQQLTDLKNKLDANDAQVAAALEANK